MGSELTRLYYFCRTNNNMLKHIFLCVFLIFTQISLLKSSNVNTYSVVSTTQNPSQNSHLDNSEICLTTMNQKIEKLTQRVDSLEETFKHQPKSVSYPKNCKEVQLTRNISGIYLIQPIFAPKAFMVVCNMETHGGGWTYFLNRFDGSQNFFQKWKSYKRGFGHLGGEFWLGLEYLHQLTGEQMNELLIELVDWDLKKVYAHYNSFSIGNEEEEYALKVLIDYEGTAGDSFSNETGSKFSTIDRDQDEYTGSCAELYGGAWWYKRCMQSHLTGKYEKGAVPESQKWKILCWNKFRGERYSLKEARMMVRPRDERNSPFLPHGQQNE